MSKGAALTFELIGKGLTPHTQYGATFEWKVGEASEGGGFSNELADANGKVAFPLNPTALVAVASIKGPGTLTLAVTRADGSPLEPHYTVEVPVA